MNKGLRNDLIDASDASERVLKRLPDMSLQDKVDAAARLRAVVKNCEAIDKAIKDEIKKKLRHKEGTVLGDVFKANLNVIKTIRFDSGALKDADIDTFNRYCVEQDQERITFEAR